MLGFASVILLNLESAGCVKIWWDDMERFYVLLAELLCDVSWHVLNFLVMLIGSNS